MTFYLKYRPQTIEELDLESVRDGLKKIIKSGSIPHAFLFSGPKGTGKTSAARILAKVVNCKKLSKAGEPCNVCDSCISITKGNNIDVIELDAASNRGIDDIRSLKEGVSLAPVRALKKVYIIDEAHMLTLEAANAFLKTLEEPPDHVIFILATTNPEKLPETVISRLVKINFTKAKVTDIARQLNRVIKGEKIKTEDSVIEKIAKIADGSFRDAVKILETLTFKTKNIKTGDVENLLSVNTSRIDEFFATLATSDSKKNLEFIEKLVADGIQIRNLIENILKKLHTSLLAKNGLGQDELANFREEEVLALIEFIKEAQKPNPIPQLPLEIAVIKYCGPQKIQDQKPQEEQKPKENEKPQHSPSPSVKSEISSHQSSAIGNEIWQQILQNVRSKNVSVEALLRAARPLAYDGKILNLGVYYRFHKEHLEGPQNTRILEEVIKPILGVTTLKICYQLIDKEIKEKPKAQEKHASTKAEGLTSKVDQDIIAAAKEIFG